MAIYTRNAVCAPIRAEEGITGVLCSKDSPIGGYPTDEQLARSPLEAGALDAEGRCVMLEFPAFVLVGVYCPASRDETRDDFRLGFLNALDARVRNLVSVGKRVVVAGDLNICREEIDTANAEEQRRRLDLSSDEYVSTPARRLFNQLLLDGKVVGDRDDGRAESILVDLCRSFHPTRRGMFTCWETKINARPGNFGSRIDYILCSRDMKDWFSDANIQEGLLGSDHCPIYAVMRDTIHIDGAAVHIRDVMSPHGMFKDGIRQREWTTKDLLPLSAKLMSEFDGRRNIRDMFVRKLSVAKHGVLDEGLGAESQQALTEPQSTPTESQYTLADTQSTPEEPQTPAESQFTTPNSHHTLEGSSHIPEDSRRNDTRLNGGGKRAANSPLTSRPPKRSAKAKPQGQQRLTGFFKPQTAPDTGAARPASNADPSSADPSSADPSSSARPARPEGQTDGAAAETWSRLLSRRSPPRCDHNELCARYVTKKPGLNCGRAFYVCARPLGPSGTRENGTPWRCTTFVWNSEHHAAAAEDP